MMKSAGQHPNIVSLIGYCTLYNKPLLVVEYCSKGDLRTYLRTVSYIKEYITYNICMYMMLCVCNLKNALVLFQVVNDIL